MIARREFITRHADKTPNPQWGSAVAVIRPPRPQIKRTSRQACPLLRPGADGQVEVTG